VKFSEIVDQARVLLQRTGKLTYRLLKREFALDDEALEDLKEQFIHAEEVAVDQDGKMLVWVGEALGSGQVFLTGLGSDCHKRCQAQHPQRGGGHPHDNRCGRI